MKNVKERKAKVRRNVENKKKKHTVKQKQSVKRKPKLRKGRVAIAVALALYGLVSVFNYFTFDNFNAKVVDYSLDFPIQEEYHNLVLESEKCSVIEKIAVMRLVRQKEAPLLCTKKAYIPRDTVCHLDEFKNVYVVGEIDEKTTFSLEAMGLNVKQYNGWFGFLKTLI